jgi:type IV pilus assembly protein PilN
MIRINLLPVREARRREDLRQYGMQFVLVLLVTIAGIGFAHSRVSDKIDQSRLRVSQMENDIRQFKPQLDQVAAFRKKKASLDIRQFKPQLDQVAAFRKKKASLEKKIDVIDGLDRARSGPVRVMDELATHTPERLWLNGLATKGRRLELTSSCGPWASLPTSARSTWRAPSSAPRTTGSSW